MEQPRPASQTVRLSAANAFAERVGEQGLRRQDIDGAAADVVRVHEDLTSRRASGELAFYDLPYDDRAREECERLARRAGDMADNLLVLGIGGSALGTTAVHRALSPEHHNLLPRSRRKGMRLFVCDNVDPAGFGEIFDLLDPRETVVNVISKSGGTAETLAQFLAVHRWMVEAVGAEDARRRTVVTTDPEKGFLRRLVREQRFESLSVPPRVGGRFTVFSPVGLFPLAAAGIDLEGLLEGARHMDGFTRLGGAWDNPAYLFSLIHVLFLGRGRNVNVLMPYSDRLRDLADWFRQLWAESLGKRWTTDGREVFTGATPVKALGTTDQHSQVQLYMEGPQDKVVTFVEVENSGRRLRLPEEFSGEEVEYLHGKDLGELFLAEKRATESALTKEARPNLCFRVPSVSPHSVGQLLYLLEVATVFAGGLLHIDPLDQPGVELGKKLTFGLMGREGYESYRQDAELSGDPQAEYTVPRA